MPQVNPSLEQPKLSNQTATPETYHGHHHHHHHQSQYSGNMGLAFTVGIILNILFVAVEFIVGKWYNSMGLLADAGHNLSDVGNLAISMAAFLLAKKRYSATFTYGFRKSTILASLLNALILFAAVVFIIVECIEKFRHPQTVGGMAIMLTAGIGILINGGTVLFFQRDKEHDVNVKGAYLHMLADTLISAGVVISGVIIYFTNWTIIDPIVGMVIAGVIIVSSYPLLTESLRLVLDGIPSAVQAPELLNQLRHHNNVSDIHHCHIWAISTTENALTAHVVLKDFAALEQTRAELHAESAEHGVTHATFEFEHRPCASSNC